MYSCQLFNSLSLFVIYLLCPFIRCCRSLFRSLFGLLFSFILVLLFTREKNNSDPELVFRYFDPVPVIPVQVHLHTIINTSQ